MTFNPDTLTWRGHKLTALAREELIAVVLFQQRALEESDRNFRAMADLNRRPSGVAWTPEPKFSPYPIVVGCLASAIVAAWLVIALRPAGYF